MQGVSQVALYKSSVLSGLMLIFLSVCFFVSLKTESAETLNPSHRQTRHASLSGS